MLWLDIWTNFSGGIFEYALSAYNNLEPWTYPLIFLGVIGYMYSATHSVITAIVAILITFGIFATTTSIFVDVPDLGLFLNIVTLVGISALIFSFFAKRVIRQ
jgi:hypothetical protein